MTYSIRGAAAAAAFAVASAVALGARAPQQAEFVQAQQANQAALREHTWKRRSELRLQGEVKKVVLEQVRYGFDGRLQQTPIGGTADANGAVKGGPLRQRVAAKKKEDFKDLMEELTSLVASYSHLPADTLRIFAAQAAIGPGEGREAGTVRIRGQHVLHAGDAMTVWIDPASSMMRRVEIATSLDGKAVLLSADYRTLDNGLTYQARSLLRHPDRELELTVETFEYQHVGSAR